jgi:amidophosphoribosyltransferase
MIDGLHQPAFAENLSSPEKPMDECGVVLMYAPGQDVIEMTYHTLLAEQHRGQQAAGVVSYMPEIGWVGHKGLGLVEQAIPMWGAKKSTYDEMLTSPIGMGHVRWSTSGGLNSIHPYINEKSRTAIGLNGHLEALSRANEYLGVDVSEGENDISKLSILLDAKTLQYGDMKVALKEILPTLEGGFCITASDGKSALAARDPWGFKPLSIAELPAGGFIIASEDTAFMPTSAKFLRDVEPGEIITIDETGITSDRIERVEPRRACGFEYIYTARPDSVIDGVNVYRARKNMGKYLARDKPVPNADVVVGVPTSGLAAAAGFAAECGIPLVEGIFKNTYVNRSFIETGKTQEDILRDKFRPNTEEIEGKVIALVDDSVIKSRTMKILVKIMKEAGAKEIHVRSAAPRYVYPCYMGMDTGKVEDLIARYENDEGIARFIEAESVAFNEVPRIGQSIEEAVRTRTKTSLKAAEICVACADGKYPFAVPHVPPPPVLLGIPMPRRAVETPVFEDAETTITRRRTSLKQLIGAATAQFVNSPYGWWNQALVPRVSPEQHEATA